MISRALKQRPVFRAFCLFAFLLGPLQTVHAAFETGEITFAEFNCAACHHASPAVENRLASRPSPRLGRNGARLSPAWIRNFLLKPQSETPGTLMPDMLHALPAAEKTETAEVLTDYLVSLQNQAPVPEAIFDFSMANEGRELFHEVGCVACHAPQEPPAKAEIEELTTGSEPLGNLASKFGVEDLAAFLRDPLKTRPGGRMPAQRLADKEARAIAIYLLRDQAKSDAGVKLPGLDYQYYEGPFDKLPEFDKLKPVSSGRIEQFTLRAGPQKNFMALRFRGMVNVPQYGDYTFWTASDDGSQLFVDDRMVVANDGVHAADEREGKARLSAGDHRIAVNYFDGGGQRELRVSWAGPGIEKQEIPSAALWSGKGGEVMRPIGWDKFAVDNAKAAKGKALFERFDCASCHEIDQPGREASPLENMAATEKGCLASNPPAGAPYFSFKNNQRKELLALLTKKASLAQALTAVEQVHRTMTALNCYACHNRDGQGSPKGLRREYFKSLVAVDLGEEGAVPPHLNGVGAKLRTAWMQKVFFNGASVRPYMATRMPQFGEANLKSLVAAFEEADASQPTNPELVVDPASSKNGLRLVGNEGLTCISCHNFAGHPSLGVPAMDLTTAPERLKSDWFRRYLLDPASLRPGTRMPSFWPDGVAANKSILNGDAEKQISAIWSYLSMGKAQGLPPGLIPSKMELVADKEPVVYRNFIQGAGSRAIGVGYPEKLDLAFDANQMRLALLWQGPFIDASRHRTGRGEGYEPPMGYDVVKLPAGGPFAKLNDLSAPWPDITGKAAGYQFRGYVFDAQRRPKFCYQFAGVDVEDFFLPVKLAGDAETSFHRTLTLRAGQPMEHLWFRAAVAEKIEDLGNDTYLIDGNLRVVFPPGQSLRKNDDLNRTRPVLRKIGAKFEVLVPVIFQNGDAEIGEGISW